MRKVEKITKILTIIMVVMMLATICTNTFAAVTGYNPDSFSSDAHGKSVTGLTNTVDMIINIVSIIGSGAAIIILIVLGIKYMMGSAEEKAEYKKTLLPYIIGAGFVFGASLLVNVIYNFMA